MSLSSPATGPALRRLLAGASATAVAGILLISSLPAHAATTGAAGPGTDPGTPRIVSLGGGDRVSLTPISGTHTTALTALPGSDGGVSGLVVATTDGGTTVQSTAPGSSPTAVDGQERLDVPSAAPTDTVPLHFSATGRDGKAADAYISVFDVENGVAWTRQIASDPPPTEDCTTASYARTSCVLVPPGVYSVMAFVTTKPAQRPSIGASRTNQNISLVGEPETSVNGERTFAFDARDARQLDLRTPGRTTKVPPQGAMLIAFDRTAANGESLKLDMRPAYLLDQHFYLQPTAPVSIGSFDTRTRVRLEAPDIAISAPGAGTLHPEYVDRTWFSDFASDFPVVDGTSNLKVVDVGHATAADLAGRQLHGALALVTHATGLTLAEQSNRAAAHGASVVVIRNDGPGDISDPGGDGVELRVPTIRLDRAEGRALADLPGNAKVTVSGEPSSPYVYDLYLKEQGRIADHPSYVARLGQLATQVHGFHGQPNLPSTFSEAAYPFQPGDTFSISTSFPFAGGPRERTEYRIPDPGTAWSYAVFTPELSYNAMFPHEPVLPMTLSAPQRQVYAGHGSTALRVGTAPITAEPNPASPVQRAGDLMHFAIEGFTDAEGNHGTEYTQASGVHTHAVIRADDTVVGETDAAPTGTIVLPSSSSRVAISFTADNPQAWNELSTHTDTTWSFPSSTTPGGAVVTEPVMVPDYGVDVDAHNRLAVDGDRRGSFDLSMHRADRVGNAHLSTVRVDVSFDDGVSWQKARVTATGHRWQVSLPDGTGFVSLRLRAVDLDGSSIDQTTVRAFEVVR